MNLKNEPVAVAGGIASGIVLLVITFIAMMVKLEVWMLTPEQIAAIRDFTVALVALGALAISSPFVASLIARSKVTPLADPKDSEGEPLTRSDNSPAVTKARK